MSVFADPDSIKEMRSTPTLMFGDISSVTIETIASSYKHVIALGELLSIQLPPRFSHFDIAAQHPVVCILSGL